MRFRRYIYVKGTFTTLEAIKGKSMYALESALGFNHGRFSKGVAIYAATEKPNKEDFHFASTTKWNTHHGVKNMTGLNANENIKGKYIDLLMSNPEKRLIKVIPSQNINHMMPGAYPEGDGVNQIFISREISCELVGILTYYPGAIFTPHTFQLAPDMTIM